MKNIFTIVPQFLKDPESFYQSVLANQNLKAKAAGLFLSSLVFLMVYGLMTGLSHSWQQGISTALKMPVLFLATLAITLPALYFFSLAFLNVRFSVAQAGIVVLTGIGVSAFLLLGLAPVTAFFVFTSTNYAFFQLLAVFFVAISGMTGLFYILKGFRQVDRDGELSRNTVGNLLMKAWVILFGFVGAQMTWRLSPFIGDPKAPFAVINPSRDNFFVDVFNALSRAFGLSSLGGILDTATMICSGIVILSIFVIVWVITDRIREHQKTSAPAPAPLAPVEDRP